MSEIDSAPQPSATSETAMTLSEHRCAERVERILLAKAHGKHGSYLAMLVNLSRTGALMTITDETWPVSPEQNEAGLVGLRVASHFGERFEVEFLDSGLHLGAEVVRISDGAIAGEFVFFLGIRFLQPLDAEECAALDLRGEKTPQTETLDAVAGLPAARIATAEGSGPVVVVQAAPGALATRRRREQKPAQVSIDTGGPRMTMRDLLMMTVERQATDLHIKGGSPVRIRVNGTIENAGNRVLGSEDAVALAQELLSPEQFERFEGCGDLDFAHSLEGHSRFRVNVLRARGEFGMAVRRIPEEIPSVEQLGLAPICLQVSDRPRGLILVTGPTGSGKSTTLAAMLNHVNKTRACHIVTMEDPIEYLHREEQAHITQREIGRDTEDFASSLKRAMRQDPDVIMVGEMRDLETIALAVTAAETGHLVLATLHTTSAILTVDRIVDVFPPTQQRQIRMQLADCLLAIFSQTLMPRRRGGLVAAQEIVIATAGVRALIREGKTPQITNMMQTGGSAGMQLLEDALNQLVATNVVSYEMAVAKANSPDQIRKPAQRARA